MEYNYYIVDGYVSKVKGELNPNNHSISTSTNIDDVIKDYRDGKLVLLSSEQVQFMLDHKNASLVEVLKMEIETPTGEPIDDTIVPVEDQVVTLLRMAITGTDISSLSDEEALEVKDVYYPWEHYRDNKLPLKGGKDRVTYNGSLWKVNVDINAVLDDHYPGAPGVEALYTKIVIESKDFGTINNPIPYGENLELKKDLYYIDGEDLYLCIQDLSSTNYWAANTLSGFLQII